MVKSRTRIGAKQLNSNKNQMREYQPLGHLTNISKPNFFMVLSIGFLFGTSLSILDSIIYQLLQAVFLTIELRPLTVLWLANMSTSLVHIVLIIPVFIALRKKIRYCKLDWKRMLDQSKYLFSVSILLQVLFTVCCTTMLPESFFISLDLFDFAASESLQYTILPVIFSHSMYSL